MTAQRESDRGDKLAGQPDPAPPGRPPAVGEIDDAIRTAFVACFDRCGYDLSVLERDEQIVIVEAVRRAGSGGRMAQFDAAEDALRSMAAANGWSCYLHSPQ